jgi:hypothetical protein
MDPQLPETSKTPISPPNPTKKRRRELTNAERAEIRHFLLPRSILGIMNTPSWKAVPLAACEKARIYFSKELAESMDFDPEVDAFEHVGAYLTDKVLFFLRDRLQRRYYGKHLTLLFVAS